MRTKILSLLLALLAISNFSFGQGKYGHFHTRAFHVAVDEFLEKFPQEFKKEKNELKPSNNLYMINEGTEKIRVGMLIDEYKSKHYNEQTQKTDGYTWVFVLSDFKEKCKNLGMEIFDNDGNLCKLDPNNNNGQYKNIYRLSQLLGIDVSTLHNKLYTFEVEVKDMFRPAYQTSVHKNEIISVNEKEYTLDLQGLDKFNNTVENKKEQIISWLANLP